VLDSGQVAVTVANLCFTNLQQKPCGQGTSTPAYLVNTGKVDLKEGEFYVDSLLKVIMYYPLPEELEVDMDDLSIFMPTLEVLIDATETDNITFEYIEFAHATYARPNSDFGYVEQQSGALVEHTTDPPDCNDYDWIPGTSNLLFTASRDVTFVNCKFTHLSAVALEISGGSHNCMVQSCFFEDIGGAGVQIGHYNTFNETDVEKQDIGNKIVNSRFLRAAAELHGNAAVQVGYSRDTIIENNLIEELYYSGISIGWGWSREVDTFAGNNSVSFNLIDGFKLQGSYPAASLGDGGGIYALGPQQDSVMEGNWLNNMGSHRYHPIIRNMGPISSVTRASSTNLNSTSPTYRRSSSSRASACSTPRTSRGVEGRGGEGVQVLACWF
jgi:hypothetical protein